MPGLTPARVQRPPATPLVRRRLLTTDMRWQRIRQACARPVRPRFRHLGRTCRSASASRPPASRRAGRAPTRTPSSRARRGRAILHQGRGAGRPDRLRASCSPTSRAGSTLRRRAGQRARPGRPQLRRSAPTRPKSPRTSRRSTCAATVVITTSDGLTVKTDNADLHRERRRDARARGRSASARARMTGIERRRQLRPPARRAVDARPGAHHRRPRRQGRRRRRRHRRGGGLRAARSLHPLRARREDARAARSSITADGARRHSGSRRRRRRRCWSCAATRGRRRRPGRQRPRGDDCRAT